ncbi:CPBP family intramembrane glutamic endopeptidase [Shimazuella kribbensis]|uniref:CPBP family intramembrane glutamic endopeptidase n=1 Tax=Shimazuella kribbensis TaxID=139808 RepID=UPI0004138EDB|nr:CPBP family intramembrane glutamic endopeptidase [Shimazuella kribbensis]
MNSKKMVLYRGWGQVIGLVSVMTIIVAIGWLVWNGETSIRYSADHQDTIPIWNIWVPSFVCILLIRIIPFYLPDYNPISDFPKQQLTVSSVIFLTGAILFPISLLLVDDKSPSFQLWYVGIKLAFLLIIPWVMIRIFKTEPTIGLKRGRPHSLKRWIWVSPLLITVVWIYLSYFSVFSTKSTSTNSIADPITFIIILSFSFLINSLLEELFYRVWLQTRLELLIGTWPAILFTSILWAIWHITIQGTGQWNTDLATVISNQGVTGIFLGYLWARFRNVWILILIHGIINAPPQSLLELWNTWN